jgi:hypothetical protein
MAERLKIFEILCDPIPKIYTSCFSKYLIKDDNPKRQLKQGTTIEI